MVIYLIIAIALESKHMLAIAPKVFREALSSQVRIDDGTGHVMQFKLSEADLWVRRLTEETQSSLRSAVEQSVAEAIEGDAPYLFPYVSLKNLAHGEASAVLQSLVSPYQARRLSDFTIGEVIDTYDVTTAVKLAAWLQGTKGPEVKLESLKEILGLEPPKVAAESKKAALTPASAKASPLKEKAQASAEGLPPDRITGEVLSNGGPQKSKQTKKIKSSKTADGPEAQIQLELPKPAEHPAASGLLAETTAEAPKEKVDHDSPISQAPADALASPDSLSLTTNESLEGQALSTPTLENKQGASAEAQETDEAVTVAREEASPAVRRRQRKHAPEPMGVDGLAAAWLAASPVMEKRDFEDKLKASGLFIQNDAYLAHTVDDEDPPDPQTDWVYLELSGRQLVCQPAAGRELMRIHNRCIRHIEVAGAACINIAVTKESANPEDQVKLKAMALAQLEKIEGFTWLDKNNGWFYIKRHKSRVLKTILKIMAACRKLPLEELMAGVYRSKTGLGPPISKDVFRAICKHTAGLQVYKDDVVGAKRGWCKPDRLLSEVDQKLVRMFQGKRKVISYQALVQHFTDRGLTTATALATPELHPLLKKVAPMLYTLRGLTVEINPW